MTSERRFEQDLPELLAELAPVRRPDYRDDIVRQTAPMRQRPAWMFPERWLPVSVITTRAVAAPPIRWRIVGLIALLLVALVVGFAALAGSQRHVPAPFGPAANGVVAYEEGGDIFTADPITGVAKAVVTGTQQDLRPNFSDDGTHMVFVRQADGSPITSRLVVARSDGTSPVVVTPNPVSGFDDYGGAALGHYAFSPAGTEIALWSPLRVHGTGEMWIAEADGGGVRRVDTPLDVVEASWLPPDGTKLIVTASTNGGPNGIFALDPRTGQSVTIVAPDPGLDLDLVKVSPDGSRLAYVSADPLGGPSSYRVHVIGVDGRGDVTLPMPSGATFQDAPAWSNDGTRLAITRGYAEHNEDMALAVLPADGSGVGVESRHGLTGCCDTNLQWSPDDSRVLVTPENLEGTMTQQLLLDPSTGEAVTAPWTASNPPAWQRIAP